MNFDAIVTPILSASIVGLITWGGMRAEIRHLQESFRDLRDDLGTRVQRAEEDIKKLLAK